MLSKIKEDMGKYIAENIIGKLPESERHSAVKRVESIVNAYQRIETDALTVLLYATKVERIDEFAEKLEINYRNNLQSIHPNARNNIAVPGVTRTKQFIIECYKEIGIVLR